MRIFKSIIFLFIGVLPGLTLAASEAVSETSDASPMCPDAGVFGAGIVDKICWSCMMPVKVFGVEFKGDAPSDAYDKPLCSCNATGLTSIAGVTLPIGLSWGFTSGMWLPSKVVEVVRTPFCSPLLGGVILGKGGGKINADGSGNPFTMVDMGGSRTPTGSATDEMTRYQVHAFEFPILTMMGLITELNCLQEGFATVDLVLGPSEFMPNWNDSELAILMSPEAVLFVLPLQQEACGAIDGPASTLFEPIDNMMWCAGFWGTLMPFSGPLNNPHDPIKETSLLSARYMALNHRLGFLRESVGKDAMCGDAPYSYIMPKSQYKISMMYPSAEAEQGDCCHNIGEHTVNWGLGRTLPGTGEDYVSLWWQWHDCCVEFNK